MSKTVESPHLRSTPLIGSLALLVGVVLSLAVTGCQSTSTPALPVDVAANQYEVTSGVFLAGDVDAQKAGDLAASGALVIDLRTSAEGTAEEAKRLTDAGVDYVNVPVAGATLDPALLTSVATLLDSRGDRPVVLHCRSGNRAGMVYAALQIRAGASVDDALTSVGPVITSDAVRQAVRDYAEGS